MKIKLHNISSRKNPIVEVSTHSAKILLDMGETLGENDSFPAMAPEQSGDIFAGAAAVFLTGYSTDYSSIAQKAPFTSPVYCGALTGRMLDRSLAFRARPAADIAGLYKSGESIAAGDIRVTPHLVDSAAFEGYLLEITSEGKTVLFSGDFRANGRISFERMVKGLPAAELLISACGVISELDINPLTERDVSERAAALMAESTGPVFVLQTPTDFDRAASMHSAARRSNRVFLEELFMASLLSAGEEMPSPAKTLGVKAFLTTGYPPESPRYRLFSEMPRVDKAALSAQKFAMCVRPSMKKYLKTLFRALRFKGGIVINALPEARAESAETREFIGFLGELGLPSHTLRPSGHAHAKALKALVAATTPKIILPVYWEHHRWLAGEYTQCSVCDKRELEI